MPPLQVLPLPVALERVTITQAWHPLGHADPAHAWLRELIAAVAKECSGAGGGMTRLHGPHDHESLHASLTAAYPADHPVRPA